MKGIRKLMKLLPRTYNKQKVKSFLLMELALIMLCVTPNIRPSFLPTVNIANSKTFTAANTTEQENVSIILLATTTKSTPEAHTIKETVFDNTLPSEVSTVPAKHDPLPEITSPPTTSTGVLSESDTLDSPIIKVVQPPVNSAMASQDTGSKQETNVVQPKSDGASNNDISVISEIPMPSYVEIDKNGIPVNYKGKCEMKATAYTGDPSTASGLTPMPGCVAVDPEQFPYGTELYIISKDGKYVYGYCIAADTGGFVQAGNTDIDVYLNSEDACYEWGNRDVIVYIL